MDRDAVADLLARSTQLAEQRRRDDAVSGLRRIVEAAGIDVAQLSRAAELLGKLGEHVLAARGLQRALAALGGRDSRLQYRLGKELAASGDFAGAVRALSAAVSIEPNWADAHNQLGLVHADAGRAAEAIACFRKAVELDPTYSQAFNNLGTALRAQGELEAAALAFSEAARVRPGYALALANLGVALRDLGRAAEAEKALRAAIAAEPRLKSGYGALASLLRGQNRIDEAAQYYHAAARLDPQGSAAELTALAEVLAERGDDVSSQRVYGSVLATASFDLRANVGMRLTLKTICESADQIAEMRAQFATGVEWLRGNVDSLVRRGDERALDELQRNNFYLAYHGEDDRRLQEAYADFVAAVADRAVPQLRAPCARRPEGRIRVGFVTQFLAPGTIASYFGSWIEDLAADADFAVHVYHLQAAMNPVAESLARTVHAFRRVSGMRPRVAGIARTIRDDALDVLIYPELGMEGTCLALAALRLAPLQFVAWGHPVTTGYRTLDAFLSPRTMEPAGAQAHYTEPLHCLPGLGTRYARPQVPSPPRRSDLGLPEDGALLLCPQSPFKIHPDNDRLFARVLDAVPGARLVFFAGRHPAITDRFMRRLAAELDRHGLAIRDRTIVLPALQHRDYLRVNLACDAMLDTLHWSGGNTSLDAIACALPIVTLPGRFMRGRQSAAMLDMAGVPECIVAAEEAYRAAAARLACDADYRADARSRLRTGAGRLFGQQEPSAALAAYIRSRVAEARSA